MANKLFAGVDEVGRGCLAGPVVSCVVILKKNIKKKLFMSKKNIYIPLKVVPYIFLSMVAITVAATTNIII